MTVNLSGFVDDIIDGVTKKVRDAVSGVKTAVQGFIQDTENALFSRIAGAESLINETVSGIEDGISDAIEAFQEGVEDTINSVVESATRNIEKVANQIRDTIDNTVASVGGWLGDVVGAVAGFIDDVGSRIGSGISDLADGIRSGIDEVTKRVGGWIEDAVEGTKNAIATVANKVGEMIRGAGDFVGGVLQKAGDIIGGALGALRTKLEELLGAIQKSLQGFGDYLDKELVSPLKDWWAKAIPELRDLTTNVDNAILGPILGNPYVPAELKNILKAPGVIGWVTRAVVDSLLAVNLATGIVGNVYAGNFELIRQGSFAVTRPGLIDAASVIEGSNRNLLSADRANDILARYGYPAGDIATLQAMYQRYLGIGDEIALYYRGIVGKDDLVRNLKEQGFSEARSDLLITAAEFLPNIPDLIRMAVREVFSPEIAERFGQYEDFPKEFAEHAAKLGMKPEWAERYWAAHWDLPSPYQGFEMLHRGIIDQDDLKLLMRALDIMPFWRDKLIEMSYNPLTRVDVRRMHKLKILDHDQVVRAYLDLGYNPQHAVWLTEFTEALNKEEVKVEKQADRELTKAEITRAYQERMLERVDAIALLMALDYDEPEADFILALIDWRLAADERDRRVSIIKKRYLAGVTAIQDVWGELSQLNLTAAEMQNISDELELQTIREPKLPSRTELEAWVKKGIIEDFEYIIRLIQMGYQEIDARHFLQALKPESPFVEGALGRY